MLTIALIAIIVLLLIPASFGGLVLFHTFIRKKKAPVDPSNRINHLKLVWLAMNHEDEFAEQFPWLKNDVSDNLKK